MWWRWYYDIIIGVHTCTAVLGAQLAWVTSFLSEHDRGTHYSYSQWQRRLDTITCAQKVGVLPHI